MWTNPGFYNEPNWALKDPDQDNENLFSKTEQQLIESKLDKLDDEQHFLNKRPGNVNSVATLLDDLTFDAHGEKIDTSTILNQILVKHHVIRPAEYQHDLIKNGLSQSDYDRVFDNQPDDMDTSWFYYDQQNHFHPVDVKLATDILDNYQDALITLL